MHSPPLPTGDETTGRVLDAYSQRRRKKAKYVDLAIFKNARTRAGAALPGGDNDRCHYGPRSCSLRREECPRIAHDDPRPVEGLLARPPVVADFRAMAAEIARRRRPDNGLAQYLPDLGRHLARRNPVCGRGPAPMSRGPSFWRAAGSGGSWLTKKCSGVAITA